MTDERDMSGHFLQSNGNAEISTFRKGTLSRVNTGEDVMYSFIRRMLIGSAILYIPTIRPAVLFVFAFFYFLKASLFQQIGFFKTV
ncbi:uncharacterized protein K441DRAFT_660064 [Cenococcum geophilum 1.58]|uniref:uncharacterized protein n=1 Tax=Cenococcum geophilum 1.58 TaxID=794803 RepID=UPI00358E83DE|nr:hypothetical protein K441DRAFT_660064 [Cenococcum geophilum 1.58]